MVQVQFYLLAIHNVVLVPVAAEQAASTHVKLGVEPAFTQ